MRRAGWALTLVVISPLPGCTDSPLVVRPGATDVAPVPSAFLPRVVSGQVLAFSTDGARPVANLSLQLHLGPEGRTEAVVSGVDGSFKTTVPHGVSFSAAVSDGGGYQVPCPVTIDSVFEDTTYELHVVADAVLLSTGTPRSLPLPRGRVVSGTVYGTTRQIGGISPGPSTVPRSRPRLPRAEMSCRGVSLTNKVASYSAC